MAALGGWGFATPCAIAGAVAGAGSGPRVIVSTDFERRLEKTPTFDAFDDRSGDQLSGEGFPARAMIHGLDPAGDAGVFAHVGEAASGKGALRMQNAPGLTPDFLPGLVWWLHGDDVVRSGTLKITVDVLIPEQGGNALTLMARRFQVSESFALRLHSNGGTFNGKRFTFKRGAWSRFTVTVPLGVADAAATLTVAGDTMDTQTISTPLTDAVNQIDWIGFLLPGQSEGYALLDNLEIVVENEKPLVATPLAAWDQDTGEGGWKATPPEVLDVFPPPEVQAPAGQAGETVQTSTYYPSGSQWGEGLDERMVYHREIKHTQDAHSDFTLRIGRGGQLYSLRGAFGESLPPQSPGNPWNDEVWQFVSVCTKYNGTLASAGALPDKTKQTLKHLGYAQWYFLHNSGAYMNGMEGGSFYGPLLGASVADRGRAYRTVNWGVVPQPQTIHRSPLLYYVQTRDVGEGVIEMTWMVHNFSVRDDVVFDHLNAPWGGTRISNLPVHYVSTPAGELLDRKQMRKLKIGNGIDVRKTGGWNLSCASQAPDSPSLALVFGRDRRLEAERERAKQGEPYCQFDASLYRDWAAMHGFEWNLQDWRTRPENSHRNYEVAVVIPKFRLAPGTSIWYRSFLVVNRKDRAVELAKSLVDKVDYGLRVFDPATTPMTPIYLRDGAVVATDASGRPEFKLYAQPVPGTKPLFLIVHATTGRHVITSDPYVFHDKAKLDLEVPPEHPHYDYYKLTYGYAVDKHNSYWKRLLGYGYVQKPASGGWERLSSRISPALFAETTTWNLDLWVKKE